MTVRLQSSAGQISLSPTVTSAHGALADDLTEHTPTNDGYVVAAARTIDACRVGGIVVQIADPGDPTGSTLRGTLRVVLGDDPNDTFFSDTLVLYDFENGVIPEGDQVLRLGSAAAGAVIDPGTKIHLLYGQTGDAGEGVPPTFRLLGWPLVTAEPGTF